MESAIYLSKFSEDTKIIWDGYHTKGDGGGNKGLLKFGAHTADGGYIFSVDANTYIQADLKGDNVSALKYGVRKFDGSNEYDSILQFKNALANPLNIPVSLPSGRYGISDTFKNGQRGKALIGDSPVMFPHQQGRQSCEIKWLGGVEPRKAMIIVGQNEVGAEPTLDGSGNILKNIYLDGDNKVGFLVYGTYLTNETLIDNIGGQGGTETNFYFARGWFAAIRNVFSRAGMNNGISLALPLVYADGTQVNWVTNGALELNNVEISNIRSHSSGQRFNTGLEPDDWVLEDHYNQGYGVGLGEGNSFTVEKYSSEQSAGAGLYLRYDFQPISTISRGYIETANYNLGLDTATEVAGVIVDTADAQAFGGGLVVNHLFVNFQTGGGIYTRNEGNTRGCIVQMNHVRQPRFLKDINGVTSTASVDYPLNRIKFYDVYEDISVYNLVGAFTTYVKNDINLRYTWKLENDQDRYPGIGSIGIYFVNNEATWNPSGSIAVTRKDGTVTSFTWPSEAPQGETILLIILGDVLEVNRAGGAGTIDQNVDMSLRLLPSTRIS